MPNDYDSYFEDAGRQYNVDPQLLRVIASAESSDNPNAVGPQTPYGQASGIMQLTAPTAKSLGVTDRTDPKQSIYGAAKLISGYLDRYGNPTQAIAAYYGGPDQTKWGPKTNAYVQKVSGLYGKPQMSSAGQSISDQDLLNALMGKPTSSQGQPQPNAPGDISDDQLISALTAGASKTQTTRGKSVPPVQQEDAWTRFGHGLVQGGMNVIDPVATGLARLTGTQNVTLGGLLPSAEQAHATNVQARQQFDASQPGFIGRSGEVGGELLAATPLAMTGEGLLGAAASKLPYAGEAINALRAATAASRPARIAARGVTGAAQGAEYGALTSGGSDQPFWQQVQQGAETGGLVNAGAPELYNAGKSLVGALSTGSVNPARAALAKTAIDKFGIPLRWSQISQTPFSNFVDSVIGRMPMSGLGKQNSIQESAFTKGVASTFGENANALTQDVMSHARDRISNMFDQVAQNTTIGNADELLKKLGGVISEAQQTLPEGTVTPLLKQVENIGSVIDPQTKTISGQAYQAMTRKGSPLDRAMNSGDPNIRFYAGQIRSTLDDALQSSASPQDLQTLQTARLQWKNMRTVQDLAAKAGIEGEISPRALLGAVKKSYKDMTYSGAGDIGNLARIGQEFLTEAPSSGSGERIALYEALRHGGRALGYGLTGLGGAAAVEAPETTAATLAGILAAGHLGGNVLRSKIIRDTMLRNSLRAAQPQATGFMSQAAAQPILNALQPYALPASVIGIQGLQQLPQSGQ